MKKISLAAVLAATAIICSACSDGSRNVSKDSDAFVTSSSDSSAYSASDTAAEEKAAEHYLSVISEKYTGEILKLNCFIAEDGSYACAAIVGERDENDILRGSVLYADKNGVRELLGGKGVYNVLQTVKTDGCTLIISEEGYGGSGSRSHVWKVTDENCEELDYSFSSLSYQSGNDFCAHIGAFDSGHTHKKYYFYWNGNEFREYGGISVTEEQLLSLDGGKQVLDRIKAAGFSVSEIYYRSNNIININYINGNMYDNITLIYKDGAVTVDESDKGWYNGSMGNIGGSYGGRYLAAAFPDMADYPQKVPF